jgi:hypothetical protein
MLPALLLFCLSACAVSPAAQPPMAADLNPALDRSWIGPNGEIRWPPDDGFAAAPVPVVLMPGMLIDRFGSDGGRFFSPKGAAYAARALPYACDRQTYIVYRVVLPVVAWSGKAAPWFGQPGGATQFETDAQVFQLKADHTIEVQSTSEPPPCGKN